MKAHDKIGLWSVLLVTASFVWISPGWDSSVSAQAKHSPGIIRGKSAEGFPYMVGGVGSEEREDLQRQAADYNVRLTFAEKAGVYLANVDVTVQERSGKEIINLRTNGPWLYLQLPPATYTVRAAFDDQPERVGNLVVKANQRVARVVRWDLPEEFPIYASMKERQN